MYSERERERERELFRFFNIIFIVIENKWSIANWNVISRNWLFEIFWFQYYKLEKKVKNLSANVDNIEIFWKWMVRARNLILTRNMELVNIEFLPNCKYRMNDLSIYISSTVHGFQSSNRARNVIFLSV